MMKWFNSALALAKLHAEIPQGSQGQRGNLASLVIGVAIAVLVIALIFPIALSSFFGADTTSWDAQTILVWGIIPVVALLGIALIFLRKVDD